MRQIYSRQFISLMCLLICRFYVCFSVFFLVIYLLRKPGGLPCRISHSLDLLIDPSRCNLTCCFVPCIVCKLFVRSRGLINFRFICCYFVGFLFFVFCFFEEQVLLCTAIRKTQCLVVPFRFVFFARGCPVVLALFVFWVFLISLFYLLFKFLAALGLRCCAWAFSGCGEWGLLLVAVRRLLIAVASLVAEHRLQARGLQQLWQIGRAHV